LEARYKNYWAFHKPLWDNATALPAGEVFSLDTLMPRQDFVKTPVFNEWWKQADYSLAILGANLPVEDRASSLICVINARGNDALTSEETRVFETAARHVSRAVRVHRQLWKLDLMNGATPERFQSLRQGAILVDAAAKVLFANAPAWAVLDTGDGLVLTGGCLASTDGADTLQRLIASCARGRSTERAARRRTRCPARPKSSVPPSNVAAASIQRPGRRDPLARIAPAGGYRHGG
jgi:hypothetical protein